MKIINDALLNEFRGPGRCDWCNQPCRHREAAHLFARQMGGGRRIDARWNLAALGGAFDACHCHASSHTSGIPSLRQLLMAVATRERTTPKTIHAAVCALAVMDKDWSDHRRESFIEGQPDGVQRLIREALGRVRQPHLPGNREREATAAARLQASKT